MHTLLEQRRKQISTMLMQHEEFILIGLTGRVGSGCSEAAKVFSMPFDQMGLPPIYPGDRGLASDEERDRRIVYRYATHHWLKFDIIKVRTVITSFFLEDIDGFFQEVKGLRLKSYGVEEKGVWDKISAKILNELDKKVKRHQKRDEERNSELIRIERIMREEGLYDQWVEAHEAFLEQVRKCNSISDIMSCLIKDQKTEAQNIIERIYQRASDPKFYANRNAILKVVDEMLDSLGAEVAKEIWNIITNQRNHAENPQGNQKWKNREKKGESNVFQAFKYLGEYLKDFRKKEEISFVRYVLAHDLLPAVSDSIHDYIVECFGAAVYTELYQKYGNSLRKAGRIIFGEPDDAVENAEDPFAIPRRINQFVKSLRHPFSREIARPTRIVIDSIKNSFEAVYLRERYSAFYLFAISANEEVRIKRLTESEGKNLTLKEICFIDWNEYSDIGARKYKAYKRMEQRMGEKKVREACMRDNLLSEEELDFVEKVIRGRWSIIDRVREEAYEGMLYQFLLQDIGASIENADVFISNNHIGNTINMELRWEIVRNVCLIMYPGLVVPTPIERCMQTAFAAKANSGCLSRQVGAVVADVNYNTLSIGWNEVPCGDISCGRKNLIDISTDQDLAAYTDYEIKNPDFRMRIRNLYEERKRVVGELLCGLPWRYCFKDVHMDGRNPMRSRAMHAEEKALAAVGDEAIGGYLFTTSSPCEMCSKNAKNHQISKIFYIEPYPGISEDQYSKSGNRHNRAEHVLFTGAIGRAYTQMYTPIMPHKDVLELLGINR